MTLYTTSLTISVIGLLITATLKSYHYSEFYSIAHKEKSDFKTTMINIHDGLRNLLMIYPFKISVHSSNEQANSHKRAFEIYSRIYLVFWTTTVLLALPAFFQIIFR